MLIHTPPYHQRHPHHLSMCPAPSSCAFSTQSSNFDNPPFPRPFHSCFAIAPPLLAPPAILQDLTR
jgi:hypothetical protein